MATSNVETLIQQLLSPQNVHQVAVQTGVDEATAQRSIAAALPTLLAGLGINAANPQQAESILAALDKDHDGNILEDIPGYIAQGGDVQQGNKIVGHILGSKQQGVEESLARSAGISTSQMGGVLAALAPLVMGALSRDAKQSNTGSDGLAGLLLGQNSPLGALLGGGGSSQADSGLGGLLGGLLGGGGSSQADNGLGGLLGALLGGGNSQADSGLDSLLGGLLGGGTQNNQSNTQSGNDLGSLLGGLLGR
jgi:hypothetical protein